MTIDDDTKSDAKVFGKDAEITTYTYKEFSSMIEARNQPYEQFNNKKLIDFIDDSRKRVNGYTPERSDYSPPKEDWQSNSFNPITRSKLKAIVASVASSAPRTKTIAVNENDQIDVEVAELMEGLKKYSRLKENVSLSNLLDVWNMLADGTVITYEGYLKTKQNVRLVKSYNQIEGKAEIEEEEMIVNDECISESIPVDQFYIQDFYIFDIQKQPAVARVRYLNEAELTAEFGHCKNFKNIIKNTKKRKNPGTGYNEVQLSFYNNSWFKRIQGKRDYEVIEYYEKGNDVYRVVCNGLLMKDTPLLWGRKKKAYPFAKGISEPFSGREFFYGNAIGSTLQFGQDTINTFYNMMIDKTLRSFSKPRVIGIANQDAFERENEDYDWDVNIYVNDVNQIKEMDIESVNQSELAMFGQIKQEIDSASVDQIQQGISGQQQGITATEHKIANEKARQKAGILFILLEDFALQKDKLRMINIITNYTVPKVEEINGEGEKYRTFAFPDQMKDGETGIKEVRFVKDKSNLPSQSKIDAEMKEREENGTFTEVEIYPSDYLDKFEFDSAVVTESLYNIDKSEQEASMQGLLNVLATIFPDFLEANKDYVLKNKVLPAFGENMDNFQMPSPVQEPTGDEEQNKALPALLDNTKIQA